MRSLTFLLCLLSFTALAQVPEPAMLWLKGYGGNGSDMVLTSVTKTIDGGFIISYQTTSTSGQIDSFCSTLNPLIIFQKYNSDASILEWTKCISNDNDTFLLYIYPQSNGTTVFGGEYNSIGWGFYICKEDTFGSIVWSHGYSKGNNPILRDMISVNDGGFIMLGEVSYADTNFTNHYGGFTNSDLGIIKLDSNGKKVWSKVLGGSGNQAGAALVTAPHCGCYVLGSTTSNDFDCTGNHGGADVFLARLDSNGNILWHNDLGGSNDDGGGSYASYACANSKGGIIIATVSASNDGDVSHHINNPGGENIWVMEIDSNNNILWNNCYGGGWNEIPSSVCKAIDGSIWIAGRSLNKGGEVDTAYGEGDAWFVHADSMGNFLGAKVLGGSKQDVGYMVYPLSNGEVFAGGYYILNNGSFSVLEPYSSFPSTHAFLTVFAPWTTSVNNISTPDDLLKIFPNPTTEQVLIETTHHDNIYINIIDEIGRIIYKNKFNDKIQLSINGWVSGVYYIQVIDENGYKNMQKLIIQH